jgi:hypothetical protein
MMKLKILVTGPFSAGKTTFIKNLSDIETVQTEELVWGEDVKIKKFTTVGLDFGKVNVSDDIAIYLFGTPGQDRFEFMWEDLLLGSHGIIVMLDRSDWKSLFYGKKFLDFYATRTSIPIVVVANKSDVQDIVPTQGIKDYLSLDSSISVLEASGNDKASARKALYKVIEQLLH